MKKSFRDLDNVLYDWIDSPSSDYCVWRGITCDHVTFNVVALNLSGLNLDGELSPAIGQLRSLLTIRSPYQTNTLLFFLSDQNQNSCCSKRNEQRKLFRSDVLSSSFLQTHNSQPFCLTGTPPEPSV